MDIKELLTEGAVCELREKDKAHVFQELARRAAAVLECDPNVILHALNRREDLGSTGIGAGVALPHARLDRLERPFGLFARLRPAVPFDAVDEEPVDLVFLILMPETAASVPLQSLACVARRLRDPQLKRKLRSARGAGALYSLLTE